MSFLPALLQAFGEFHICLSIFKDACSRHALQKTYLLRFESLNVTHINYTLKIFKPLAASFVKIATKYSKKDFFVLITFYVCAFLPVYSALKLAYFPHAQMPFRN